MSDISEVIVIVEGRTEQIFIEKILTPYLADKGVYLSATQISKPGQKGGDVKYSRAERDIGNFLKQRQDTYITIFFDYYGLKEWPKLSEITNQSHIEIAELLNEGTIENLTRTFPEINLNSRFIPFMAMHEFEALLFSNENILADALNINVDLVSDILHKCGEPEKINNSPETAPSKRLNTLKTSGKFKKTTEGIAIAEQIGIDNMRSSCPLFNEWITSLEKL